MGVPIWEQAGKYGRWRVEFRSPRQVRRFPCKEPGEREKERRRKEAEAWAAEVRRLKATKQTMEDLGIALPASSTPAILRDCAPRFLAWLADSRAAPSTLAGYRSCLNATILPVLGDLPIHKITPGMVTALEAGLRRRKMVPGPFVTVLSSLMRWAVGEGLRQDNPCIRPRKLYRADAALPKQPPRTHTREQRKALLEAMPPGIERGAVALCGWAALRKGEARGLRPEKIVDGFILVDMQLQRRTERRPKYNSVRTVPIGPTLEAELAPLLERAKRLGLPYLLAKEDGQPPMWPIGRSNRKTDGISTALRRACNAAGIDPPANLRSLRATCFTLWIESGIDPLLAESWMGHSLRGVGGLTGVSAGHYLGGLPGFDRSKLG